MSNTGNHGAMDGARYATRRDAGAETGDLLTSLGYPNLRVHNAYTHFDFTRADRRILVIGPMGSGKTEYASRVWRDARVALKKSDSLAQQTSQNGADRREVFIVRSQLDATRFADNPPDALSYRGGYERCGTSIAYANDSFDIERLIKEHPEAGTWIIDEASFYDERLAYVILEASQRSGLVFIFPTLMLNFRRMLFNSTASLLLEHCSDLFPVTAYCEHPHCLNDAFYSYRYYFSEDRECPALYFDPLIIAGGDTAKHDPREPNYCARCARHHLLPGKEYTFMTLRPLGERASRNNSEPLVAELRRLHEDIASSQLYGDFNQRYRDGNLRALYLDSLRVPCLAERALVFLFAEQNLVSERQAHEIARTLDLDMDYLARRAADNGRTIE